MFREMRRNGQKLSERECIEILQRGSFGVLAVLGDNDYPYAVPLNYTYIDGAVYFHVAKSGHKLDAISKHDKCSFCVTDSDRIVPEKFTTAFRSIIAFGTIEIMQDDEKIYQALDQLAQKYSPKVSEEKRIEEIEKGIPRLCMLKLSIEHLSGKQGLERIKKQQNQKLEENKN